ncbi:N-acetyltransferase [Modestobacter versicolor]|uniref:N-acetyltransferase n=1 Tax=Modestobacter versicolor TaxID=429133 RepID=A0A323V4M1_9ACTN|nr:N-acetyltransferase [Modestobacter versicolor]MBB3675466.1 hypothetical protein [Modestobacter versicolor]PZA19749.1 N-acetyltransferase [Modestobacter versicolor]
MPWLPDDFAHPLRADLPTGHHLRPMSDADTEIDFPAVMGSRERLWSVYGQAWGWPPATMTVAQDREDLARHAREIATHQSFLYGLFAEDEAELLGCLYVDPPERVGGADAEVSWWVVDGLVGTEVERAFDDFVPRWLAAEWPLTAPRFVGRDLSWAEWLALPELDR